MAERGFPLTQKMLMAFAWAIAKEQEVFKPQYSPGEDWKCFVTVIELCRGIDKIVLLQDIFK